MVIDTGFAEKVVSDRLMQRNPWMAKGLERGATIGAGDRLRINRLLAARTCQHQLWPQSTMKLLSNAIDVLVHYTR